LGGIIKHKKAMSETPEKTTYPGSIRYSLRVEEAHIRLKSLCEALDIPLELAMMEVMRRCQDRTKTALPNSQAKVIDELYRDIQKGDWPINYENIHHRE
jgi:hypothetical protein